MAGVPTSKQCPADTPAPCVKAPESCPSGHDRACQIPGRSIASVRRAFYGRLCGLSSRPGVYKQDALNDAFIHDDRRGEAVARWLLETPDALVVIATPWYERLFAPRGQDSLGRESPLQASAVKTMAK